jgi:hypothetical protein
MTARGRTLVLLLAALTLAGTGGRAEPPASEPEPPPAGAGPTAPPDGVAPPAPDAEATERAPEPAAAESEGLPPVYVPPTRGTTRVRVGAATRGERPDHVAIDALAPDHVAYTTRAQPVLCWYLSAPTTTRIEITLIDDRSVEPLLDVVARPGIGAGVQRLSLADHGVSLEPGRVYHWFVALVPDPQRRSNDVISSGAIERVAPGPELQRELRAAAGGGAWRVLAAHGIWYDALAALSARIEADPSDRSLRELRSKLLEQVELRTAAAGDRAALGS